jgi:hypothetical protein
MVPADSCLWIVSNKDLLAVFISPVSFYGNSQVTRTEENSSMIYFKYWLILRRCQNRNTIGRDYALFYALLFIIGTLSGVSFVPGR